MSKNNLLIATIQDVMSFLKIPGTSLAGEGFRLFHQSRLEDSRDIIFKELAQGTMHPLTAANKDEMIGVVYQYMQCAARGTARLNLNLLAQAIKGDIDKGQLHPDNFTKHLNTLSTLTRNEIIILGRYWHHQTTHPKQERTVTLSTGEIVKPLGDLDLQKKAFNDLVADLCPEYCETDEHLRIALSGLTRTGLITQVAAITPIIYYPSVLMAEVAQLIDFERALEEEKEY